MRPAQDGYLAQEPCCIWLPYRGGGNGRAIFRSMLTERLWLQSDRQSAQRFVGRAEAQGRCLQRPSLDDQPGRCARSSSAGVRCHPDRQAPQDRARFSLPAARRLITGCPATRSPHRRSSPSPAEPPPARPTQGSPGRAHRPGRSGTAHPSHHHRTVPHADPRSRSLRT